jgi:hypothetical protein
MFMRRVLKRSFGDSRKCDAMRAKIGNGVCGVESDADQKKWKEQAGRGGESLMRARRSMVKARTPGLAKGG